MGIDIYSAKFLRNEVKRGLKLGRLLTLGHQAVYLDAEAYHSMVGSLGIPCREAIYADDLFRGFGAKSMDVMDVSNYEGANVLHNLNEPITAELVEKYDCVFDGGALEHVFNLPQAVKNCMEMVKIGGHFVTITPTNAYCGHGFYQFSPELFYSALSDENGYSVQRMLFVYLDRWYSVQKPADISQRVELLTREPTLLFVSAKRFERKPVFAQWPQQSDYVKAWNPDETAPHASAQKKSFKDRVVNSNPIFKRIQSHWRRYKLRRRCSPSNREWFSPVHLD